ncbi:hypothetical protein [Magnetovibrio blakemorei]|uniref:Uncharacterized protein n=1 Tax=Magnetovibrio blakemorei TaxID=28181 RepID=A0A1E5Q9C5_9PROT|nr:hypothetical protein [Magnetovibrio blakemorei]OEJ68092.1 hypothetical protein BEN30_07485 [Magnetovibrio blakemorei]
MLIKLFAPLAVLGLLISAQPAHADTMDIPGVDSQSSPKELLEGASRMMLQALELMIKAVPQYAAPVILPNGDILIRRKPSEPDETLPKSNPGEQDKHSDQDRI